jgi:hypothetical protein
MAVVLATYGYWTTWNAHATHAQTPSREEWLNTTTVSPLDDPAVLRVDGRKAPRVDLYGNEIDDAVGDYRQDRRGDTYEWHSPQTEVAKLAPPGV